jgi:hypothetical protein
MAKKIELHTKLSIEEAQERLKILLNKRKNFWREFFMVSDSSDDPEVIGKIKGRKFTMRKPDRGYRSYFSSFRIFYGELTGGFGGQGTKVVGSF